MAKKHEKTEYVWNIEWTLGDAARPSVRKGKERKNPDPEPTDQLTSGLSTPAPYAIPKAGNGPHFKRRRKKPKQRDDTRTAHFISLCPTSALCKILV